MNFVVLGLNHDTAPLNIREKIDFSKYATETYLHELKRHSAVRSGMVLSTCNRVEVYAAGSSVEDLLKDTSAFLSSFHSVPENDLRPFLYSKSNREAVRHLFRVAASLDSMVIGEPQILGQVKEAYYESNAFSFVDPFFEKLLQRALSVAKRIRTETQISEQAVSISFAAVELAKKIFGNLSDNTAMIVGAGEMAELAAKNLKREKVKEIYFTNRSYEHSVELARTYAGIPILFSGFEPYLKNVDIVIVSTAAPHYVIKRQHIDAIWEGRGQSPMFVIDISVPRNVDPQIHEIEDLYLYNIDDLKAVVQTNLQNRQREAEKATLIVDAEVERFYQSIAKLQLSPVIQRVQDKCEDIRQREMERLLGRVGQISPDLAEEVHKASASLVRKILNDPILFLQGEASKKDALERAALICRIFGVEWLDSKEDDKES